MARQVFNLNGAVDFAFPFPVRDPTQLTLTVLPGTVVSPSEYAVLGAGPASVSVTVRWTNAPSDGSQLEIARHTEPERVTDFTVDPVTARSIDDEFNNQTQIDQDQEMRLSSAETTLVDHEGRITTNEATLVDHEGRIVTLEAGGGGGGNEFLGGVGPTLTTTEVEQLIDTQAPRPIGMLRNDQGLTQSFVYGGSSSNPPEALGVFWQTGREGGPAITDGRPIIRLHKVSSANRAADPALWDEGCINAAMRAVTGDAFRASITGEVRSQGDASGDLVGVHARGSARGPNAHVFGLWAQVNDVSLVGGVANGELIAGEFDVQATGPDPGWADSAALGGARGILSLTSGSGSFGTISITMGGQGGTGGWWTGLLARRNGFKPNTSPDPTAALGNGETVRIQGATAQADRYAGIRFHTGHLNYALSTVEVDSFDNEVAVLLKPGHQIRWGTRPQGNPAPGTEFPGSIRSSLTAQELEVAGFSLNFLSNDREVKWRGGLGGRIQSSANNFNPGGIFFEDAANGSIALKLSNGITALRTRNIDPDNPVLIRVGGVGKAVEAGAADSGGPGFRVLRVTN